MVKEVKELSVKAINWGGEGISERFQTTYFGEKTPYVGGLPHLLQLELLDTGLIGGDGGALDADLVLLDGFGGIDRDCRQTRKEMTKGRRERVSRKLSLLEWDLLFHPKSKEGS